MRYLALKLAFFDNSDPERFKGEVSNRLKQCNPKQLRRAQDLCSQYFNQLWPEALVSPAGGKIFTDQLQQYVTAVSAEELERIGLKMLKDWASGIEASKRADGSIISLAYELDKLKLLLAVATETGDLENAAALRQLERIVTSTSSLKELEFCRSRLANWQQMGLWKSDQFTKTIDAKFAARKIFISCEQEIARQTEEIRKNPHNSRAFSGRGDAKFELGRYGEAIADYTEAIRLNPRADIAFHNRGQANYRLGRYEEAIADYTEAIRLNPRYATAFYNRGEAKYRLDQYEEAIADYTEVIRLDPQDAIAFNNRGQAKYRLGQYDEAIADYTEEIRLNPQDARAFNARGAVKYRLARYEEAIADYTKAIRLNPEDAMAFNSRGDAKYRLARYQEAVADYTEAIRLNPQDAIAFNTRGLVNRKLCRYKQAIADFDQALLLKAKMPTPVIR